MDFVWSFIRALATLAAAALAIVAVGWCLIVGMSMAAYSDDDSEFP